MVTTGKIQVNDFHFGKKPGSDYVSFDTALFDLAQVAPRNKIYFLDSIVLTHPAILYEQYDDMDNVSKIFGRHGANITAVKNDPDRFNLIIELVDYIRNISKEFFSSYYKVTRVAVYRANVMYNDYSPREKFSISANPLNVTADSIDKQKKEALLTFTTGIKPYGSAAVDVRLNPGESGDFDLKYHLEKLPVPMFNPYLITYTSFPMDRGVIEANGNWKVRKGNIESTNHLIILDPRVGKRLKKKDTKWIPMPLAMAFIRERGNVIDYEIPVTGDLKKPKFHLWDVITDIISNIFVKPVTTPYRQHVKEIERELEKSLVLKWELRGTELNRHQEKFVKKMVDFLVANQDAKISVYPSMYTAKEKEYILFFEAKKKYYLSLSRDRAKSDKEKIFTEEDSIKVDKMSVKDSSFIQYLNRTVRDSMMFTIQEKCRTLIGQELIDLRYNQLNKEREAFFISYFKKEHVENRVNIHPVETTIPFNGFSYYKIDYKGKVPESLQKAFDEMSQLNDERPRIKYEKDRAKNGVLLNDKSSVK